MMSAIAVRCSCCSRSWARRSPSRSGLASGAVIIAFDMPRPRSSPSASSIRSIRRRCSPCRCSSSPPRSSTGRDHRAAVRLHPDDRRPHSRRPGLCDGDDAPRVLGRLRRGARRHRRARAHPDQHDAQAGLRDEFSAGICMAASTLGPIFPPSIPLVIFAMAAEISPVKLLLAGTFRR